jgi:hypothetical protein
VAGEGVEEPRTGARGPRRDPRRPERRDVRATFAFVGHLFLDRCERVDGRAHPEMVRPDHSSFDGDWYDHDPCTDLERDPLWYGLDLVRKVRDARPAHEIGAHGFSHALLDGSRELARSEMEASAAAARAAGVTVRSFVFPRNVVVFPRNVVGHTGQLSRSGFTHYRAAGDAKGAARAFLGRLLGAAPPVSRPRVVDGVVEVPTSIPMVPAIGIRRIVPLRASLAEVRKGLERARDRKAVFHLWTHPHNFVEGRARMLRYLDGALALVTAFRDWGDVEVRTMGEVS